MNKSKKNIKQNYKKNKQNNFNSKSKFIGNRMPSVKPIEKKISEISGEKENVSLTGYVNKVVQTGGPTIFVVSDGTGNLSLKGIY